MCRKIIDMAKRTQRKPPAKSAPKPLTPPERLTRRQISHEFGRIGDKYTVAEMSRRTGIPQSTLRAWIKKGEVSKRGLERSRQALPKARSIRRIVSPQELKRRQERKTQRQQEKTSRIAATRAVHYAFATGITPVLEGAKIKNLDPVTIAVARGSPLPRSPSITLKKLDAIRDAAFHYYDEHESGAENEGFDYRRKFEPTDAGQQELSDAWIAELGEVLDKSYLFGPIVRLTGDGVPGYKERNAATNYTGNATAMWQTRNYVGTLPEGYWLITYKPEGDQYEVKVWVKDSEKKSKRKGKAKSSASQMPLPGVLGSGD